MSGAQIGGIVGGTIGFVASGFNPMGAQIGYAIGASVGAYVDPVRTYGPRIGDSSAQTSSVGGVIPFGFGTFTTAGNLIWRDPKLREIAKTQRQGKGGGAKSTTYTYTRSYAVGICRGPIYGVKWIKRNGKKVYTTDPAATQEEKQASAKFAAKLKIYLGTETQMPDPTIVAVEGMANVPGHRGLAYIVVEHDDLTDLGGAVPQYEFCVQATPPDVYLASQPYPQKFSDAAATSVKFSGGDLKRMIVYAEPSPDSAVTSVTFLEGETRSTVVKRSFEDASQAVVYFVAGELKSVIQHLENTTDVAAPTVVFANGEISRVIVYPEPLQDHAASSITFVSGELKIP